MLAVALCSCSRAEEPGDRAASRVRVALPAPRERVGRDLNEVILERRSIRSYTADPLTLEELGMLLWSAQGITGGAWFGGMRAAPSAGATYPLETYAVVGSVSGLEPGVYRYVPQEHALVRTAEGDRRERVADAALHQTFVGEAAAIVALSADFDRTTRRYGGRGRMYVHMEAGHAAQNVYLEATALGLGTCAVGAFDDRKLRDALGLSRNEDPLYLLPVGRVKAK
ncbi:MAG: SagB/ThcOx family dehydrogenase [Kiritimatiellae bacterium]|nr:SagB/ThcOx family dehydrogenase [Kiritimatiellia bacterium]